MRTGLSTKIAPTLSPGYPLALFLPRHRPFRPLAERPAIVQAQATPIAAPQPGEGKEDARLKQLFHDSDEASLARNPISGIFRGDMRRADRIGDFFSDAYIAAERAATEKDLKALGQIDRARLTPTNQVAYDVFKQQGETTLRGFDPAIVALTIVRPMDHFYGIQTFYPEFASGQGAAPFNTVADYENNLKRNVEYARLLDEAITRFRQGMASGIVQPKLVVRNMIAQFDNLLAVPVEKSTFYGPVMNFPATVPAAEQARLKAAYAAQIRDVIVPAERRMRTFLADTYLPVARDTVGLSGMPGGDKLYAYLIEQNTTLPLKAEDVHQLGLSEVARILKAMEVQKQAVGFKGSLAEFFTFLRTDPRFAPKSAAQLREGYEAIGRRVDARIREQFSLIPKTPLEIRPVPAFKEKTDAGGSYQGGTPDGMRPGVFYYNTYDLLALYVGDGDALSPRSGAGPSFPDQPGAGKCGASRLHALRRQHRLCRGLGPLCRDAVARTGHGNRSLSADGRPERRDAARDAAGRRYRHPRQGLDPRSCDRLYARQLAHGAHRRDRRGRALHRHSGPGLGL
ncbi:hypothetical protein GCM10020258_41970 [Sphingomonas yabuuchiae]